MEHGCPTIGALIMRCPPLCFPGRRIRHRACRRSSRASHTRLSSQKVFEIPLLSATPDGASSTFGLSNARNIPLPAISPRFNQLHFQDQWLCCHASPFQFSTAGTSLLRPNAQSRTSAAPALAWRNSAGVLAAFIMLTSVIWTPGRPPRHHQPVFSAVISRPGKQQHPLGNGRSSLELVAATAI
jgi:hypothetical protein